MKIALSSSSQELDKEIDVRFGRAKGFLIYDTEKDSSEYIDNVQNLQAVQGAGIQAAQNVVNKDVDAVITGHCGPKAFRVLTSSGIKIYAVGEGKISDLIEKFKKGELEEAVSADVEGHWV